MSGASSTPSEPRRSRTPRARSAVERERAAELERRREQARSWLIGEGFLEPTAADEYRLTEAGRDWLLWALWEHAGSPGVPASAYETEATA